MNNSPYNILLYPGNDKGHRNVAITDISSKSPDQSSDSDVACALT